MDKKGYISYYTRIKSILAILKAQNKIYPINKIQIKILIYEFVYYTIQCMRNHFSSY